MNARHPFSRLVSAWRDKFPKDRKTGGETYWFRKYGKFISTKFEQDYYDKPEEYYISFPAFADYVAWIGNRARFDHHWKTFNYHCRPCQLRFDFITKAETSSQDSKFIINQANISHIPHIQLPGKGQQIIVVYTTEKSDKISAAFLSLLKKCMTAVLFTLILRRITSFKSVM